MHVELEIHARRNAFGRAFVMALEAFAWGLAYEFERAGTSERILRLCDFARNAFAQTTGLAG